MTPNESGIYPETSIVEMAELAHVLFQRQGWTFGAWGPVEDTTHQPTVELLASQLSDVITRMQLNEKLREVKTGRFIVSRDPMNQILEVSLDLGFQFVK